MTNQIIDLEKRWKILEKTKNLRIFQLMDVAVQASLVAVDEEEATIGSTAATVTNG